MRTHRLAALAAALACTLLAAVPAAHAERAPVRPLALGDMLPPLSGRDLAGAEVVLPRDLGGRGAFLALGFTRASRVPVEAWAERFRREHGKDGKVTFFKVAVLGGSARIARPFIESGMKKGTPPEFHHHVITMWSDAGEWKKRMGYVLPDAPYVALVDHSGRLAWKHAGPLDDAAWAALTEAMAGLD